MVETAAGILRPREVGGLPTVVESIFVFCVYERVERIVWRGARILEIRRRILSISSTVVMTCMSWIHFVQVPFDQPYIELDALIQDTSAR